MTMDIQGYNGHKLALSFWEEDSDYAVFEEIGVPDHRRVRIRDEFLGRAAHEIDTAGTFLRDTGVPQSGTRQNGA